MLSVKQLSSKMQLEGQSIASKSLRCTDVAETTTLVSCIIILWLNVEYDDDLSGQLGKIKQTQTVLNT